jgi:hypothetical protein
VLVELSSASVLSKRFKTSPTQLKALPIKLESTIMNLHQKSFFGELSAFGTVLLTLALFVISLPAIFLSTTKPVQRQQSNQEEYVEASVSS